MMDQFNLKKKNMDCSSLVYNLEHQFCNKDSHEVYKLYYCKCACNLLRITQLLIWPMMFHILFQIFTQGFFSPLESRTSCFNIWCNGIHCTRWPTGAVFCSFRQPIRHCARGKERSQETQRHYTPLIAARPVPDELP